MPVSTDQSSKLGLLKITTIPEYYVSPRLVDQAAVGFEELEKNSFIEVWNPLKDGNNH